MAVVVDDRLLSDPLGLYSRPLRPERARALVQRDDAIGRCLDRSQRRALAQDGAGHRARCGRSRWRLRIARARGERSRGNACQRQARALEETASFHRSISYAVLEARTEFEAALRFGAA